MIKRHLLALCLALSLLLPALAMGETFTMMGFEQDSETRVWADNLFFDRMAEETGTSFTFQQYSEETAYDEAKAAVFSGAQDLPDVLFKAALSPEEEMRYVQAGQLVDLSPYLEEHAPTLAAILEARPDWKRIVAQPDGTIASLPALNGAERQCCIWINREWLDALGLQMPTDIDGLTEVLRAFRDGDPNGNGSKDEVPLTLLGPWEAKFMLHAWGLVPNDYNIFVDAQGTVQFAPSLPEYRDFVAWLQMAVAEGLVDEDGFRTTHTTRSTQLSTEDDAPILYGGLVSIAPYTLLDMDDTLAYAVLPPLSFGGEQVYRQLLGGVGRGTFAITSACTDIPAALRWVDALYTEAGGRLAFAGLEGEDYAVRDDGSWSWNASGDYLGLSDLVDNRVISAGNSTPGLEPAAFMRNGEIAADTHTRRQVDSIRDTFVEPFPVYWPTDAAREARIAELQLALATCLDEAIGNFALGKEALTDESWNALLAELDALGKDEFVRLWQEIYDELDLAE